MKYMINYDLRAPGRDYQSLYDELEDFKARRVLESQWVFNRYNTNARSLRDYFWQFLDSNDRLLIAALDSSDWAGRNLMFDPNNL